MKRSSLAVHAVLLLAVGGAVALAFIAPGATATLTEDGPSCIMSGESSTASCEFSCATGAVLHVSASSADTPPGIANVFADADCAGIGAHCEGPKHCEGVSGRTTPQSGAGRCQVSTDEPWWAQDPVQGSCAATTPDGSSHSVLMTMAFGQLTEVVFHTVNEGVTTEVAYAQVQGTWQKTTRTY